MEAGTESDEAGLQLAPRVRPRRGDGLVLATLWSAVAVVVIVTATRQVHPGSVEQIGVGVILLAAAIASILVASRAQLVRAAPWVVGAVVVLVVVGCWNPWQLAAVTLLLRHPFAAGIAGALLGIVLLVGGGPRRWATARNVVAGGLVLALSWLVVVAGFDALFVARGVHIPSEAGSSVLDVRLDRHDGFEPGRCAFLVLRVGQGLRMRERTVADVCYPTAAMSERQGEIGVCVVGEYRTGVRARVDRETLALLGDPETFEPAAGQPCPAFDGGG